MKKVYIQDYNYITPLGRNSDENWEALVANQSGIQFHVNLLNQEGGYASLIPNSFFENTLEAYDVQGYSRIVKMVLAALLPIFEKYPVNPNSTLILSTTKGDIAALEQDNLLEASIPFLAEQIETFYGFRKKPIIVSNACVSGALALATAKRLIQMGIIEDAYVIGVDEVTKFVLSGFSSFQAMSPKPCAPFDVNRKGVTLGEAVAVAYVSAATPTEQAVEIAGDGAVNDANHISGPSRTGEGLYKSMVSALKEANLSAEQIQFISAHGTATNYNDEMESIAFDRLGLNNTPVSSFKSNFGHTLGASGLLETLICCQIIKNQTLLPTLGFKNLGVSKPLAIVTNTKKVKVQNILKTASGFGGCNTALILKKID